MENIKSWCINDDWLTTTPHENDHFKRPNLVRLTKISNRFKTFTFVRFKATKKSNNKYSDAVQEIETDYVLRIQKKK